MTIEVKQLIITSTVETGTSSREADGMAIDQLKADIVEECRRLVREMLQQRQER